MTNLDFSINQWMITLVYLSLVLIMLVLHMQEVMNVLSFMSFSFFYCYTGACQNRRGNFAAAIMDYQMALEKDQQQQEKQKKVSPGRGRSRDGSARKNSSGTRPFVPPPRT